MEMWENYLLSPVKICKNNNKLIDLRIKNNRVKMK